MRIRKDIKIGITALGILALTYWGISFLKGKNIFKSQNSYVAVYDNVADMKVSSPVYYNGVKIGSVTAITMKELTEKPSILITIYKKYKIPVNSTAVMKDASIMGGKAIEIVLGDSKEYLDNMDTISTKIQPSVLGGIGDMFDGASSAIDSLSFTISQINKLLGQENVNNLSKAIADLPEITGNVNGIVKNEKKNIEAMIQNLNSTVKQLHETMPKLNSTISNIDTLSSDMKNQLPVTLAKVDSILNTINGNSGTVGLLLNDDAAYNNLNQALVDLQALLTDLKANPKRYVHFSVFGKKNKK